MKLDKTLNFKKVRCVEGNYSHGLIRDKVYDVISTEYNEFFGKLFIKIDKNGIGTSYLSDFFEPVLDSAENPPQEMKLTPELEASEPKFEVGNKVYKYGETDVKTVLEVFEDGYMRISNYPHRVNHEVLCHATPENHAMLSKPYPRIEFEQPAKELKGSDLARAMLERGDRRIYGYASDNSDNDKHGYECVVRDYDVNSGFGVIMSNARYEFFSPFNPRTGKPLTESVLDE